MSAGFDLAAWKHDRMQALLHGVDYALDDDLPVPENIADIMQAVPVAWPCPASNDDPPSPDLTIEKP